MNRRHAHEHEASTRHQELQKRRQFNAGIQRVQRPHEKEPQLRNQHPTDSELCFDMYSPDAEHAELLSPIVRATEDAECDVADPEELIPLSELWEVQGQDINFVPQPLEELSEEPSEHDNMLYEDEDIQPQMNAGPESDEEQQGQAQSE